MTNEEAKKAIGCLKDVHNIYDVMCGDWSFCWTAIEALEKQIPKKPIIAKMEWISQPVECKCPNCGEYVCKYDTWAKATLKEHHCKCGQAIDWSEDND